MGILGLFSKRENGKIIKKIKMEVLKEYIKME